MKISLQDNLDRLKDIVYLADININANVDITILPNFDVNKLNPFNKKKGETKNDRSTSNKS